MPETKNGIEYTELYLPSQKYRENWATDGASLERFLETPFATSDLFKDDMLGHASKQGASLHRVIPEAHPYYPSAYAVECRMIEAEGFIRELDGTLDCDTAIFHVTYRKFRYDVKEDDEIDTELDRYVVREKEWSFQQVPVPSGGLVYDEGAFGPAHPDGAQPVPQTYVMPFGVLKQTYTWKLLPRDCVPKTALLDLGYKINSVEFDGFSAGRVLYGGAKQIDYETPAGDRVADVQYSMLIRREGWNKFPDRSMVFVLLKVKDSSPTRRPFQEADLNDLFLIELFA